MYNTNGFSTIINYSVAILIALVLFSVCAIFAYKAKKWNDINVIESTTKQKLTQSYENVTNKILE